MPQIPACTDIRQKDPRLIAETPEAPEARGRAPGAGSFCHARFLIMSPACLQIRQTRHRRSLLASAGVPISLSPSPSPKAGLTAGPTLGRCSLSATTLL